jgi:energy-coupling factor transporter ATP-binding protein EcfA2
MNFKTLDFGAPAAERDINHGLVEYFVKSEAYSRVQNRQKYIVIGNRGTGKSALFKFLAEQAKQNQEVVIELNPEDYSYEILNSALIREKEGAWAKQGAYAAAWKYLIYLLVMKGLNNILKGFKSGSPARIYAYLRDRHKDSADSPIGVLVSYIKRIEGLKIGPFEANVKTRQLAALYKLEELHKLIGDLKEVLSKHRVRVFVDELDRGWDSSEDAKAFVAGLFQAAISINELSSNLTVYISLRQELYDSIPALYEDAQKYRDVMELIRWDEPSLKHLIALRVRHSVSGLAAIADDDVVWNTIFSGTLQYRQTKGL